MTAKKVSVSKKTSKDNQRIGKKYTKQTKTMVEHPPPKEFKMKVPSVGSRAVLSVGRPSASVSA